MCRWLNYLRTNAAATRAQIESNRARIRAAVVFGHSVCKDSAALLIVCHVRLQVDQIG